MVNNMLIYALSFLMTSERITPPAVLLTSV